MAQLKEVRAIRNGSYDGHRRRAHSVFVVRADTKEDWFVDIGPASEDAELPTQISNAQAPSGKSFVEVMAQLGTPQRPAPVTPVPITLAQAQLGAPVPVADVDDLVG